MRWHRWMMSVALAVSVGTPFVWGRETQSQLQGKDQVDEVMGRYNLHPSFQKLGRGVSNALAGWMELPINVQERYSRSDTGGSFFTGVAYGVFKGAVRTAVGVYETVTFFLPYPENFAPILPTLDYFQKTSKHRPLPLE